MSEPQVDEIRARYPSTSVGRRLAHQEPHQMADDIRGLLVALEHAERALAQEHDYYASAAAGREEMLARWTQADLDLEASRDKLDELRTRLAEAEGEVLRLRNVEGLAWATKVRAAEQRGRAHLDRIQQMLKTCSDERLQEMYERQKEAEKWKAEGDNYGWNFHQGMSAGMNWADIIYQRIGREVAALRKEEPGALSAPPPPVATMLGVPITEDERRAISKDGP